MSTQHSDTRYWICSFSNNQHSVHEELGDSWDESSFYLALRSGFCQGTAMILDSDALPLTRSWCLFELLQTFLLTMEDENYQGLMLCTSSGVLNRGCTGVDVSMALATRLTDLRLEDATASCQKDKELIENLVSSMPGGFEAVNVFVRTVFREALFVMKGRFEADFSQLTQILEHSAEQVGKEVQSAARMNPNSMLHQATQLLEATLLQRSASAISDGSVCGVRLRRSCSNLSSAPNRLKEVSRYMGNGRMLQVAEESEDGGGSPLKISQL
jgi:hypothetical protein